MSFGTRSVPVAVRMDPDENDMLQSIADATGETRSEVIRRAIRELYRSRYKPKFHHGMTCDGGTE